MSTTKYVNPRRKKRVFCTLEAPFPVPIATITSEPASSNQWFYYTAYLSGKCVVVRHSGDIDFLYKMGFFGKGNLSRSQPEFNRRFHTVRVPHPIDTDIIVQPRVVSRRVYKNHVSWSGKEDNTGENLSDTSDTSEDEGESLAAKKGQMEICAQNVEENDKPETSQPVNLSENCSDVAEPDVKASGEMEWVGDDDFWGSEAPAVKNTEEESWEGEANVDFCGVKEDCGGGDGQLDGADIQGGDRSLSEGSQSRVVTEGEGGVLGRVGMGGEGVYQSKDESWGGDGLQGAENRSEVGGVCSVTCGKDGSQNDHNSRNTVNCEHSNSNSKNMNLEDYDTRIIEHVHSEELSLGGENEQNKTKHFCKIENTQTDVQTCDTFPNTMDTSCHPNTDTSVPSDKEMTVGDHKDIVEFETTNKTIHEKVLSPPDEKYHQGDNDIVNFDPQCQEDDPHGDIFVIADSGDESKKKRKPRGKRWRPVIKTDPYPIIEHLQLCFEEAFFLSYGLGCLVVIDETQAQLNLVSLWRRFSSSRTNFLQNYIAYHYYRSKGWVPKTGLKFGCDFIVYKEGPPFYHASYSVVVKLVDQDTLTEDPSLPHRSLSWIALSGLNRITEHVAKELLLCYVIKPRGITEEELSSPACIPRFKIQEILVSRWVSSQERQEKVEEEFP